MAEFTCRSASISGLSAASLPSPLDARSAWPVLGFALDFCSPLLLVGSISQPVLSQAGTHWLSLIPLLPRDPGLQYHIVPGVGGQ